MKQNHQLERDFSDALWEWREVKSSTEAYDCSLDKEFRADDSRIATCQISRKLGTDSINVKLNFEVTIGSDQYRKNIFESKKTLWKIWLGVVQHWLVERNHPKDQRELHFQDFFNSVQAFTDSDASLSGRTGSRLVCETLIIILFHPHTNI